jgi:hypothetical protein
MRIYNCVLITILEGRKFKMKKYNKPELNLSNITANQTIATTLSDWLSGSTGASYEGTVVTYVIASE